jgi:crotonobetainyl-CoA:carnitine CoA-transferase CaiB-like acyl-CoA transferase
MLTKGGLTMEALHDVKVLDLTRLLPGNFCTLLLADYGRWYASRVRTQSTYFLALNRNKKRMKLNLKTDQ